MEPERITLETREIKKQLKKNGYSIDAIKNLAEAYKEDVEKGYDVKYTDYILPKIYDFLAQNIYLKLTAL